MDHCFLGCNYGAADYSNGEATVLKQMLMSNVSEFLSSSEGGVGA